MKTLVIYYSLTGHTRSVAAAIAAAIGKARASTPPDSVGVDVEEIATTRYRPGALGWLVAAKDAMLKASPPIKPLAVAPANYDLVVIGTPVWAFTMAGPVRTFLTENGKDLKRVAFFCTMGGKGDRRTYEHMEQLCGKAPLAVLTLLEDRIGDEESAERIARFVDVLLAAGA